jgi:hypothetical protein
VYFGVRDSFPRIIRQIIQGSSLIRFDGYPRTIWDVDSPVQPSQDWSLDEWTDKWRRFHWEHEVHALADIFTNTKTQ